MKNEKVFLFTLAAIQFTHIMDFMIMMPMSELLMEVLQIDAQQFSYLVASYTLSAGVSGFAGSFFLDKFDRKQVLLFFFVGFTIGTAACAMSPTYEILLVARIMTGLLGGVTTSIIFAIVSDTIPYERRASALGIVMMAFSLASALGLPVGLYFAFNYSWNIPFYILAGASALLIFLVIKVVPPVRSHLINQEKQKDILGFFKQLIRNKEQLVALLFSSLLIFGHFAVIPFLTPYLVQNVGFEREQITLVYLIGGVITMFSNPMIGKLADKKGKAKVFSILAIASIPVLLLLTNLPRVGVFPGLCVTALFFLVVSGRFVPAVAMVTSVAKPENRGAFMSIDSSVKNATAGLASLVAGSIVVTPPNAPVQNYAWVGAIAVGFTILSIFLSRYIAKKDSQERF